MISSAVPMVLIMSNSIPRVEVFYLGNATFDENEYDLLRLFAERGGYTLRLVPLGECSFTDIKIHIGRIIGDKRFEMSEAVFK